MVLKQTLNHDPFHAPDDSFVICRDHYLEIPKTLHCLGAFLHQGVQLGLSRTWRNERLRFAPNLDVVAPVNENLSTGAPSVRRVACQVCIVVGNRAHAHHHPQKSRQDITWRKTKLTSDPCKNTIRSHFGSNKQPYSNVFEQGWKRMRVHRKGSGTDACTRTKQKANACTQTRTITVHTSRPDQKVCDWTKFCPPVQTSRARNIHTCLKHSAGKPQRWILMHVRRQRSTI